MNIACCNFRHGHERGSCRGGAPHLAFLQHGHCGFGQGLLWPGQGVGPEGMDVPFGFPPELTSHLFCLAQAKSRVLSYRKTLHQETLVCGLEATLSLGAGVQQAAGGEG